MFVRNLQSLFRRGTVQATGCGLMPDKTFTPYWRQKHFAFHSHRPIDDTVVLVCAFPFVGWEWGVSFQNVGRFFSRGRKTAFGARRTAEVFSRRVFYFCLFQGCVCALCASMPVSLVAVMVLFVVFAP